MEPRPEPEPDDCPNEPAEEIPDGRLPRPNDAQFQLLYRHVQEIRNFWQPLLNLSSWAINITLHRGCCKRTSENGNDAVLWVNVRWEYRSADIHVDAVEASACTARELERYVVHELSHALTEELYEAGGGDGGPFAAWARRANERLVQDIALALVWARDAGVRCGADETRRTGKDPTWPPTAVSLAG